MPPKSTDGIYTHFPLFMDLRGRKILFAGGGRIAARRLTAMRAFAGEYTVIAPSVSDAIRQLAASQGNITLLERACLPEDLDGFDIAVICTGDKEYNAQLAAQARARGVLVNDSSHSENCDFYFPGIVTKDETVIGVTASGRDHYKAAALRREIAQMLEADAADETPAQNSREVP